MVNIKNSNRRSIANEAQISGVGLHTGVTTTVTLKPAPSGHGIVFKRTDLPGKPIIAASLEHVHEMDRRTTIGSGEAAVHTVEHFLAAVTAHGIDDLLVEINGPELPIADGSAKPFFSAIAEAIVVPVDGAPTSFSVDAPLTVHEGDARYIVGPGEGFRLTITIEWPHPMIGRQSGCYDVTPELFASELAPARTFGFLSEVEKLREQGLVKGGSQTNAIVLSDTEVVGTDLLWPDEFVRHKATDLLGDLALLGGRFEGEIVAFRPSHRGNVAVAQAIKRVGTLRAPSILGIDEILDVIPHRYPMLLVDRIIEIEEGHRIVGIKNVTINEPFFQGHFPDHPIMPGVLIVEAMAQVGGMLLMGTIDDPENKIVYFMSLDNVKFRRPVVPGDQIRFELEMLQLRGKTCRMRGTGYVAGQVAAEAEMMARVVDR